MSVTPPLFVQTSPVSSMDRWICSRLYSTVLQVEQAFESYELHTVTSALHSFWLHSLCDVYMVRMQSRLSQGIMGAPFHHYKPVCPVCPLGVCEAFAGSARWRKSRWGCGEGEACSCQHPVSLCVFVSGPALPLHALHH